MWKLNADGPDDLESILRDYEILSLKVVYKAGDEGAGSGKVFRDVNETLGKQDKSISRTSISRASIIFFLNRCVDNNILGFRDATGKGGHHRVYFPVFEWKDLMNHIVLVFLKKLKKVFPKNKILKQMQTTHA